MLRYGFTSYSNASISGNREPIMFLWADEEHHPTERTVRLIKSVDGSEIADEYGVLWVLCAGTAISEKTSQVAYCVTR